MNSNDCFGWVKAEKQHLKCLVYNSPLFGACGCSE